MTITNIEEIPNKKMPTFKPIKESQEIYIYQTLMLPIYQNETE